MSKQSLREPSVRTTRAQAVLKAFVMEHRKEFKELIKEALAPFQSEIACLPTRDDLKDCLLKVEDEITRKLNEKFETQEARIKELGERVDVESVAVLEEQIKYLEERIEAMENLERRIDDGEQYSCCQCLRLNNIDLPQRGENESCIKKVEKVLRDLVCGVGVESVDRAHRMGPVKVNDAGRRSQQMIVRFNSFRDRTKVYRARKKLSGDFHVKVGLDLTKKRLDMVKKAQDLVKNHAKCEFAFADVNCNLSVKLKGSKGFMCFTSITDLIDKLDKLDNL